MESYVLNKLALKALNQSKRDRRAAGRLIRQWLREDEALFESVLGPGIKLAISIAINHDIGQERRDVLRSSRALPLNDGKVMVGGDPRPTHGPRAACIPQPSADADSRRTARVMAATMKLSGYYLTPLPNSDRLLGEAQAWELQEASLYHLKRRDGEAKMAQLYGFLFQAHPDHAKPSSEQRPLAEVVDLDTIRRLDERAQIAAARVVLESIEVSA